MKGETLTDEEKTSLTPEQIAQAKNDELKAIEALRLERKRIGEKKTEDEKKQSDSFSEKFLNEQVQKARETLFTNLTSQGIELTEEKKATIDEFRKKLDSGVVTYENILEDFYAAAAVVERKNLFNDRAKRIEFEKGAADFTASQAGANGSAGGAGGTQGKVYSDEAREMVREGQKQNVHITLDEAERVVTKGMKRVYK